jgi:hypothetical protein
MKVHPSQLADNAAGRPNVIAWLGVTMLLFAMGIGVFRPFASPDNDRMAVVLKGSSPILLFFTKPGAEYSALEQAFLKEVASLGEISLLPADEVAEYPLLPQKSLSLLRMMLSKRESSQSVIFAPPNIFRISPSGSVSVVDESGREHGWNP